LSLSYNNGRNTPSPRLSKCGCTIF